MRLKASVLSLILTFALAAPSAATHAWGDYHWARSSNPFTVTLVDNLSSSAWDQKLAVASADWTQSAVLNTVIGGTGTRRVTVSNAFYGANGWVGLARIWIDSHHHITRGEVLLNESYLTSNRTYATDAFRQFVICQEIGHTFGLAHQDENFRNKNLGSCMDYTSKPAGTGKRNPSNLHPNAHDYAQLVLIYAHLDAAAAPGSTARTITWIIPAQ